MFRKKNKQTMYIHCSIVLRSLNQRFNENATMPSVFIAELQVTVKKYDNIECCTKKILWQIYVPGNNKEYLIINANDPTFLSGFNKTRSSSTDVLKSH
jgi:hypothetical protein